MNRTAELEQIYSESGLKEIVETKGKRYFEKENFSKLKFAKNDFRLSSIELYDLKREDSYFRIHYLDNPPSWLPYALRRWSGVRNVNKTGTNLLGEPLLHAKALAKLLHTKL